MADKLQPLSNMVIIRPKKAEERTKGGIILPDTAQEKPQEGRVIAVGPGKIGENSKREPMDVRVGDTVIYPKYGGSELKLNDEELIIMAESSIWAKKVTK
jgi:chaperonin GroES|tara:strand:+ start:116 stop:415 length:300 start_codon:yes stop_codon:yes gene_type:complete